LEVTGAVDRNLLAQVRQETPPPRRYASNTAAAHRRPRNDFNDFLGNLDRLPALMVMWQVLIPDLFVLSALDRITEPLTHD
jgi:hypothetical protein